MLERKSRDGAEMMALAPANSCCCVLATWKRLEDVRRQGERTQNCKWWTGFFVQNQEKKTL